jgi:hypothetical protein
MPAVPLPSAKTRRGAFSDVINFKNDMTEQEVEDNLMCKAHEKWYLILATGEEAWPECFNLRGAIHQHKLDDMRLVFGSRSPNTHP